MLRWIKLQMIVQSPPSLIALQAKYTWAFVFLFDPLTYSKQLLTSNLSGLAAGDGI